MCSQRSALALVRTARVAIAAVVGRRRRQRVALPLLVGREHVPVESPQPPHVADGDAEVRVGRVAGVYGGGERLETQPGTAGGISTSAGSKRSRKSDWKASFGSLPENQPTKNACSASTSPRTRDSTDSGMSPPREPGTDSSPAVQACAGQACAADTSSR